MTATRLFAAALFAAASPSPALSQEASPPQGVFAYEVRETEFVDRIEALGTLRARESVDLSANVSETVTAIHFDDGDRVSAGDVLVEMTSKQESALLAEARATVIEAEQQHERVKALAKQNNASQSLLDTRRRELETARARLAAVDALDRALEAPRAVGARHGADRKLGGKRAQIGFRHVEIELGRLRRGNRHYETEYDDGRAKASKPSGGVG